MRLLDLYCCAGGAAEGYRRAGFDRIVGVDCSPQPRYPFEFIEGDALAYLEAHGHEFDAVHASPPCQAHSLMSNCRPGLAETYPRLIEPTRALLERIGRPYVIENVEGAPLRDPVMLCGHMFGRAIYRHRLFEASFPLAQPAHPEHTLPASKAGHWRPGTIISVAGHCAPIGLAREVMEIAWTTREELREAIPPYYTEYVGRAMLEALKERAA